MEILFCVLHLETITPVELFFVGLMPLATIYYIHQKNSYLKKKQNLTRFRKSIIIYSKEITVIFKGRSWKFKENSMHIVYLLYTYHCAESSRVIQKKYMKLPPLLRNICPIQGDKIVAVKVTVMFRMCTALPASLHTDVIIL